MPHNRLHQSSLRLLVQWNIVVIIFLVVGCATAPKRTPVPKDLTNVASIPGIPEARFWGDEWPKFSRERFENFTESEFLKNFPAIYNKPHNYLAISGGGANGAYGAGILVGWSDSGTRPEFTFVTGISTGALTAPFAFLGSDYDDELKEVYTSTTTKDVVEKRGILSSIFNDSIADTKPLKQTIAKYITPDVIKAIAAEHKRGRRLFISTVNIDASRSVIWSIGTIASSNHPQKIELIREILRASSAIPIAFPPVPILVEANGNQYEELHVDGGTGSQVFVYPAEVDWKGVKEKLRVQGEPKVYVIRNSFLDPDHKNIERRIFPIASRTIDSLIRTQGIGDLYEIYALCERDGNDFNLAYIPSDFDEVPAEVFDPIYMSKLFELGYQKALKGYMWQKGPPGFTAEFKRIKTSE